MNRDTRLHAALVITVLGFAGPAAAQTTTPAPLVVESIPSQLVIAPDYKMTDIDGDLGQLAGIYGGKVIDDALFVGGAGYWMANGSDAVKLTYGGVLIGWTSPSSGWIRFGARGLTGIGTATLPVEFGIFGRAGEIDGTASRLLIGGVARGGERFSGGRPAPRLSAAAMPDFFDRAFASRGGISDDFFVFEPQGTLGISLFEHVTFNAAAGYRAVALTDALSDRLDGPTVGFGVEFDW
jgi:hypothetical protein